MGSNPASPTKSKNRTKRPILVVSERGVKDGVPYPTVEDDVIVDPGAVVLGAVRLGSGCVIGAKAVVLHDVAPYQIVAGNPARIIGTVGG